MKLVDIEDLFPSTYNPRVVDPERLEIIELSLKKLGFLLPIYATKKGEIISGHQRHHVALKLGLKKVPVEFVEDMDLNMRKNINLLFNKATNDAPRLISNVKLKEKLQSINIYKMAENIPDKDYNNLKEIYPCMYCEDVSFKELIKKNGDKFDLYYMFKSNVLNRYVPSMPIVVDSEYNVVNGIGRLNVLAVKNKNLSTVKCIVLNDDVKDFAYYMLNYLTMDFNIHNKYRDELRFNSYKRSVSKSTGIGTGYVVKLLDKPTKIGYNFSQELIDKFKKEYGDYILDFGAGHLRNADILNINGIYCVPFEPFVIDPDKVETLSFERSYNVCNDFLEKFKENDAFTSIFLHAVFNSVPFEEDRRKILTIVSAIATKNTKVIIWTRHIKQYNDIINNEINKKSTDTFIQMDFLDYEDNVLIGDWGKRPKIQKFYDEKRLIDLCSDYFKVIKTAPISGAGYVYCECTKPIKQSEESLMEALDFEFDLKHPNGKRLGLNEKAKKVFKEVLENRGNG